MAARKSLRVSGKTDRVEITITIPPEALAGFLSNFKPEGQPQIQKGVENQLKQISMMLAHFLSAGLVRPALARIGFSILMTQIAAAISVLDLTAETIDEITALQAEFLLTQLQGDDDKPPTPRVKN